MNEKTEFLPDQEQDPRDKNNVLIEHLSGGWNPYDIGKIERFNSNDAEHNSGWMVTYKDIA